MATYAQRLTLVANSTGSFRTFVSASEAAFAQMGWVNTNASGTINFNTVTPPNTTNQVRGYSVWRFDDDYQTVAPVFIRVRYGSGGVQASTPRILINAGKQTDNSGSLLNNSTEVITLDITTLPTSGTMVAAGNKGWGWLGFRIGNAPAVIGIERGCTRVGAVDPAQLYLWALSDSISNGEVAAYYNYDSGSLAPSPVVPGNDTAYHPLFFINDTVTNTTTDTVVSLSSAPAALMNFNQKDTGLPITMIAARRFMADTTLDVLSVAPYGVNIRYINLGNTFNTQQMSSGDFSVLMRWE